MLHLSARSPWATLTLTGLRRLADLAPAEPDTTAPTTLRDPVLEPAPAPTTQGRHVTPRQQDQTPTAAELPNSASQPSP